jgi:hypothetical protein
MEILLDIFNRFIAQLQSPTLSFLLAGMVIAAFNSKLRIPEAIYQFCVFMLLMRIGLGGGMAIREANIMEILLPAVFCVILGISIVLLGSITLARLPGVKKDDAIATSGLFGAVSAATFAAGMEALETEKIFFEAWIVGLYPFMDTPALVLAIVLANLYLNKQKSGADAAKVAIWPIIKDCFQGTAVTALLAGIVLGLVARPDVVFEGFYDLLFVGFLSVLMLTLGMDAYKSLKDLARVAHWYIVYAFTAPIVHGLMGFGLGYIAHLLVNLSPGGVIMLAIIASSNSDISGPPTLRAGIPTANPAAYIGSSTGVGTPVAIIIGIPLFMALGQIVFGF